MTISYDNGINCVYCHREIPIESISAGKSSHLVWGQGKSMNQLTLQVTCYDCGKKNYVIWRFEELLPRSGKEDIISR